MVMGDIIRRGDVFLVSLDPTRGGEIRKTRPCVVVSPDELNAHLQTFIVAPLTTGSHPYPFRVPCRFEGRLHCSRPNSHGRPRAFGAKTWKAHAIHAEAHPGDFAGYVRPIIAG
jgi:hypothetical protein